jgi:hypothetical protein
VVVVNAVFARLVIVLLAGVALPQAVSAQVTYEGFGKRPHSAAPAAKGPLPKPEPRQRLDAGALLCRTEADLQQHETAINARLDGQEAAEPAGCRPVRNMTPVTVIDRHGPARTQVKLLGASPEQSGWTDVAVHD